MQMARALDAVQLRLGSLLGVGSTCCCFFRRHGFFVPGVPLPLGGVIIAAGVIGHGAAVVAICSAVGAGQIFDRIGQVGIGVAQPFGGAGVAEAARGRELDL